MLIAISLVRVIIAMVSNAFLRDYGGCYRTPESSTVVATERAFLPPMRF
jgi:hypothetical protein